MSVLVRPVVTNGQKRSNLVSIECGACSGALVVNAASPRVVRSVKRVAVLHSLRCEVAR
jgi:hypothetical protein